MKSFTQKLYRVSKVRFMSNELPTCIELKSRPPPALADDGLTPALLERYPARSASRTRAC